MSKTVVSAVVSAALTLLGAAVILGTRSKGATTAPFPDPVVDTARTPSKGKQMAVFAGGCFWCAEAVFEQLAGVEKVISGYAGGKGNMAHYDLVSSGRTDHAESIEITFDPAKISYGQLLKVFFSVAHDPTQLNRQGPDYGRQYRSVVFYKDPEQKRVAEAYIQQLGETKLFSKPIVTALVALNGFYPAEEYHQHFVKRNPTHPYVVVNALPKLQKLKKMYPELVKK